jgi:hypothetical protein
MAAVRDKVANEDIWPSRALRAWTAEQALPRDQEKGVDGRAGVAEGSGESVRVGVGNHHDGKVHTTAQGRAADEVVKRSASWIVSVKEALRKFTPKRLRFFGWLQHRTLMGRSWS